MLRTVVTPAFLDADARVLLDPMLGQEKTSPNSNQCALLFLDKKSSKSNAQDEVG